MKKLLLTTAFVFSCINAQEINYDFNKDNFVPFDVKNFSSSKEDKALPAWYVNNKMLWTRNYDSNSFLYINTSDDALDKYSISFDINYLHNNIKASKLGFIFSYKDKNNYLALKIKSLNSIIKRVEVIEVNNSKEKVLKKLDYVFTKVRSKFNLEYKDDKLKINIDNKKDLILKENSFNTLNKVGFYLENSSKNIAFDNLKISYIKKPVLMQEDESNTKELNSSTIVKKEKQQEITKNNKIQKVLPKKEIFKRNSKYFLSYGLGLVNQSIDKNDSSGTVTLLHPLDNNSLTHNLKVGMFFNKNISSSLNYNYIKTDISTIQNIYANINYKFNTLLNPFVGLRLGSSSLTWDKDLLEGVSIKDSKASSLFYGLETGIEYRFNNNFSLLGTLAYDRLDYETNLKSKTGVSSLEHKDISSILLSLRYYFK